MSTNGRNFFLPKFIIPGWFTFFPFTTKSSTIHRLIIICVIEYLSTMKRVHIELLKNCDKLDSKKKNNWISFSLVVIIVSFFHSFCETLFAECVCYQCCNEKDKRWRRVTQKSLQFNIVYVACSSDTRTHPFRLLIDLVRVDFMPLGRTYKQFNGN